MNWVKQNFWQLAAGAVFTAVLIGGCPRPDPPTPTPGPDPPPTPPSRDSVLICARPWAMSLDESDADLTIRETIAQAYADGKDPPAYIRFFPSPKTDDLQPHVQLLGYEQANKPLPYCWLVTPKADGSAEIIREGPLELRSVLSWLRLPQARFLRGPPQEEALRQATDVVFDAVEPGLCGYLPNGEESLLGTPNVNSLPGWKPIPRSEWSEWIARFPVERFAQNIRGNGDPQQMGSCVGMACKNSVEDALWHCVGERYFVPLSGMSMYRRIGRSPRSGAYIGDAAAEIEARGILPIEGQPFEHTFQPTGNWSRLPAGWENTGLLFKAVAYRVTDTEDAFRVLMDLRLRTQFGRSSHSISGFHCGGTRAWYYENSWSLDWGAFNKSVGRDSRFYDSFTYIPVIRSGVHVVDMPN